MFQTFIPITGRSCRVLSELEKGLGSIWGEEETKVLIEMWSNKIKLEKSAGNELVPKKK